MSGRPETNLFLNPKISASFENLAAPLHIIHSTVVVYPQYPSFFLFFILTSLIFQFSFIIDLLLYKNCSVSNFAYFFFLKQPDNGTQFESNNFITKNRSKQFLYPVSDEQQQMPLEERTLRKINQSVLSPFYRDLSLLRQQLIKIKKQKMNQEKIWPQSRCSPGKYEQVNLLYDVIRELEQKQDYQKIISDATKRFQIKQYNVLTLTIEKVQQIYQNIKIKFYAERTNEDFSEQWYDNELRLFIWLFVCYLHVYKKNQDDMTKKDWLEFSAVFQGKSPYLFQYQAKVIKKLNKKSKKWGPEEDQQLYSIINHFTTLLTPIQTYKWSEIAKKLFIESNRKYFRTPKQCRQRWMNHLDPGKSKEKWTLSQDFILIDSVLNEGKKWATIAKAMGNTRTEHTVKNRYNSILRAEMKKHDELAEEARVIKKLHNRIKYTLEVKNMEKESGVIKIKVEEIEQQVERMTVSALHDCFTTEKEQHFLEAFDDILLTIKKNESVPTSYDLVEIIDEEQIDEAEDFNIQFEFKPNFPDYL